MAYVEVRPVHVADLLSREGHPLAGRVTADREARTTEAEPKDFDAAAAARRTLGVAAGAMIVVGTVVAGALGFNSGGSGPTPSAAGGEPVGALPGKGTTAQPNEVPAPQAVAPQFTNGAATESAAQPSGPAGRIGVPAHVPPPRMGAPAPPPVAAPAPAPPRSTQQPPGAPAPAAPSAGSVQTLAEPVTDTVSPTLTDVVAPVTNTVDDTLQPALSLIGGLLGR